MNEIAGRAPRDSAQPSPYIDRRALSQAWYSALYDARHAPGGNSGAAHTGAVKADVAHAASHEARARSSSVIGAQATPNKTVRFSGIACRFCNGRSRSRAQGANRRRASGGRAARGLAAHVLRTSLPAGHAVDLLVQQRGDLLRLIAIYDGRDAGRVQASLLRARAALVERGLRVELDARQKGTS